MALIPPDMDSSAELRETSPSNPSAALRSYSNYVRQVKETKEGKRAAGFQEGWLNAARQDVLAGVESCMQRELELLRQDIADRLSIMRADVVGLQRDVAAILQVSGEHTEALHGLEEGMEKTGKAIGELPRECCPDFAPVDKLVDKHISKLEKALEQNRSDICTPILSAVRESQTDGQCSRDAVLHAIERSQPDLEPVFACIRANKTIVDFTPVLDAEAKSTMHLSQMVAKVLEHEPRIDFSGVFAAIRDSRTDITPILQAVYESRTDILPIIECVRENRTTIDFTPVLTTVEASVARLAELVSNLAERPPVVDVAPILAAVREHRPTVDLRAVLAAVRETRAVDLRPVMEAVEGISSSVNSALEAMVIVRGKRDPNEYPYVLAKVNDIVNGRGCSACIGQAPCTCLAKGSGSPSPVEGRGRSSTSMGSASPGRGHWTSSTGST